ncbi:type II toxin-antitoxin system VapC family toxin [Prosthecobacter vanneervenii]|uniref:Putative nucleic acid-binding protein n=1 Tax=Prosthecobacter vanneervenii TaxID=48466 RepID=A0A7W7YAK0_9BACT|nr:type II toxin-antitoxin system VapC family toxin [Prosthecobacter vanneervenii]MBB5032656.1 putative nucleic acid-binding protein [Prosthecobacter vanneervenii]
MSYIVSHYLDASVAIKIFCKEKGSETITDYIVGNTTAICYITEFALYEILSALKRKWNRGELDDNAYTFAIAKLEGFLSEGLIQIDAEFKPHDRHLIYELGQMVKKHKIDYSDVLQIYTILNGRRRHGAQDCKTVLVTADEGLAHAARNEGLRVWHFPKDCPPNLHEKESSAS